MKKFGLLALILSLIVPAAHAQFYFRAGLGYAFPQAGQTLDGTSTPYNGTSNNTTNYTSFNIKSASFSSGFQSALGFGYMFGDHVGAQLDASFGLGTTKYTFNNNNILYSGYQSNESSIMQANTPVMLMPTIVLQTGGSSAWDIYSRFGLALPLNSKITFDDVYFIPTIAETDDYTSQLKSSFSLGFTAAAGVQYKINEKITLWGEMSILSLSLFIKESDLKNVTANGYTIPLDSVSGPHAIKYSKNVSVDTSYTHFPTYSQPFSNVGFNFGISIRLSEKRSRGHNDDIDDNRNFKRRKF